MALLLLLLISVCVGNNETAWSILLCVADDVMAPSNQVSRGGDQQNGRSHRQVVEGTVQRVRHQDQAVFEAAVRVRREEGGQVHPHLGTVGRKRQGAGAACRSLCFSIEIVIVVVVVIAIFAAVCVVIIVDVGAAAAAVGVVATPLQLHASMSMCMIC